MQTMQPSCARFCLLVCFLYSLFFGVAVAQDRPAIMLAQTYHSGLDVTQYWVSEKLDGVRARWDGKKLVSRGGNVFVVPSWFVEDFPEQALDGELWIARGRYEDVMSIVTRTTPHEGWRQVRFMVFDLPEDTRRFEARVAAMQALAKQTKSDYLQVVEQLRVADEQELMRLMDEICDSGGEGLMLHHRDARYRSGRSSDLLKLKRFEDAEAIVLGYRPGKGKYQGMVGSLHVRSENGREFFIGSGLTDEQRRRPPPIGSLVTYRFQELTDDGLPRFPVFLHERKEGY